MGVRRLALGGPKPRPSLEHRGRRLRVERTGTAGGVPEERGGLLDLARREVDGFRLDLEGNLGIRSELALALEQHVPDHQGRANGLALQVRNAANA